MTRTIRLSCIHALNWYGYKDSIRVEGNVLLAGVTGSGKSILMDLVQLVLVGDQRLIRFNQSATGDRSGRTLKGYCLGDTKEEENGATQYMRQSAITYAALEFSWPSERRSETWGLRIEFASAAEAHGKVTPFFVPSALVRGDFLDSEKRPLDHASFRAMVESRQGRIYPEGIEAYLRDMAQPVHLNFDREILRSLLPTSMSFTFLRSFDEFCRRFILPSERLDVTDVTASYRTFLGYERDLAELNLQLEQLRVIRETYVRWLGAVRDQAVTRYLEAQLRHEHARESLADDESTLARLNRECTAEDERLRQIGEELPVVKRELEQTRTLIHETPDGRLYAHLKSRLQELAPRIARLGEAGTSLESVLASRVRTAREWIAEVRRLPLELEPAVIAAMERALHAVESGGIEKAGETLGPLNAAAGQAASAIHRALSPTRSRLCEIREELGRLREQVAALRLGRLPFPTRLLDALNDALPRRASTSAAQPLCRLCEVTDERWRPAVEVAFTRKFAIVVAAEDFQVAKGIYHALKANELGAELGRESLINPAKALASRRPALPGSLAQKIATQHPVAEAIVNRLFGELICVERREDLDGHESAILPDGFMSRGAFIERTRFYDNNPFVGEQGLEKQRAWKELRIEELAAEERRHAPLERTATALLEAARERFEVPGSLYHELAEARALPNLEKERDDTISQLNNIDRSRFDDLAQRLSRLEERQGALLQEQRDLDRSDKRNNRERQVQLVAKAREETERLAKRFDTIQNETDVSPWLRRVEELRAGVLSELPVKSAAADRLRADCHQHELSSTQAWAELVAARRMLAAAHAKFADLPIEAKVNEEHDRQLARLEASDIPDYAEKSKRERRTWETLFRTHVLEKLHTALGEVVNTIGLLNTSLNKRPIGTHRYQLHYRKNPDFALYHDLVSANALAKEDELFFASAEPRLREAIEKLLTTLTEQPDRVEAARFLDYRHYYEYDLEVLEADGRRTSVDRQSHKFSGGENQSPYFIAILASYLRAYRRYASRRQAEPSLGLVPIDEAFSKLSGERIKDCITALAAFDLQGLFSMSTGNIPYAFEHCDWLVVVAKDERRLGNRTEVRNVPVSLARDSEDAARLMYR